MARSCVFVPRRGKDLYNKLKENFDRNTAAVVYNKTTTPYFINRFKDSLILDDEGIPSYNSIIELPIVRKYIGEDNILQSVQKEQEVLEDNVDNVKYLMRQAKKFNDDNSRYIALVDFEESNSITLRIHNRTEALEQEAQRQQAMHRLNDKIVEILQPLGVSIGRVYSLESAVGRVGVTEFQRSLDNANQFEVLIRIANGLEGYNAVSEEFSHTIIGLLNHLPIVQRAIRTMANERLAQDVLEEQYQEVYEFYSGDMNLVAEEAVGKIFRDILVDNNVPKERPSIFRRMVNFIVNLFRKFNPFSFHNDIESIRLGLEGVAKDVMSGKVQLTEEDIQRAAREAVFNALSERGKIQVNVLNKIIERAYKAAALSDNLEDKVKDAVTEKSRLYTFAEHLESVIKRNVSKEETMAAIVSFITEAQRIITQHYTDIKEENLKGKTVRDKFTILRNALYAVQQIFPSIDELYQVTAEEFLSDSEIATQQFMMEDFENTLSQYEDNDNSAIEFIDLSGKTPDEAIEIIERESKHYELSSDDIDYKDTRSGKKSLRVTHVIESDVSAGAPMDENSPWLPPSTNVGTGVDELIRDTLDDKIYLDTDGYYKTVKNNKFLDEVYPNASREQLNSFVEQVLKLKKELEQSGLRLYPRDIVVNGTIKTVDGTNNIHTVRVTGTVDLLAYDENTNTYVLYDFKTHHGKITPDKIAHWKRQVSLYKNFLEQKYNIKINKIGIIPIKVDYPAPKGTSKTATAEYKVSSEEKPEEYNGRYNNQLYLDGKEFKDAKPNLENIIELKEVSLNILYSRLAEDPTNGLGNGTALIKGGIATLSEMASNLKNSLMTMAKKELASYMRVILKDKDTVRIPNPQDKSKMMDVTIEHILEHADYDTTFMQGMFNSMADNPDILLQLFDKIYKNAMDEKRQKVIEVAQKIQVLAKKYEKLGVTEYSWMFEEDNRNYINKEFNRAAYNKAKKAKRAELDAKYGKHPTIGSKESKAKNEEWKIWFDSNTVIREENGEQKIIPDPAKYPSSFDKLDTNAQKFYDEWMEIKESLDFLLGPKKTHLTNTIKIRRKGIERLRSSFSGEALYNMINSAKADFLRSFDDDMVYSKSVRSVMDFDNREAMKLPLFFIGRSGNTDYSDISHDVISTLMAYADMALNYDALNEIVNPLEMGRALLRDKTHGRHIRDTKGGIPLEERFRRKGGALQSNPIEVNIEGSKFLEELNTFFEAKIYGRYLEDNGTITKANIDTNKLTSLLLKLGSTTQLGLNALAQAANLFTGIGMTNIEAVAGEFFTARTLLRADKEIMKLTPKFVAEIGQRVKTNKLSLFFELFDVKQNFSSNIKDKSFLNRTILGQIFGPRLQFIGQDAGDMYLYGRIAIAMALSYKMIITDAQGNIKETNLWDCLVTEPINKEVPEAGSKLVLKQGALKTDNTPFVSSDVSEFSGSIRYVNQHLFGIYNTEDQIAFRRKIIGRFIMQYRDWIPTALRYRFGKKTTNLEKQSGLFEGVSEVEGYYRTFGRFLWECQKELRRGEVNLMQVWDALDEYEVKNIRRAIAEFAQFGILLLLIMGMGAIKDRKDIWGDKKVAPLTFFQKALRYISYGLTREKTELGVLLPLWFMPMEVVKILKSPAAATNILSSIGNLTSLFWVPDWFDELESGYYKEHSRAYRAFMESPLTLWGKTLRRVLDPETAENYFSRN